MSSRHELTDRQWEHLGPLLPPERPATGRPNRGHRTILNGILWKLRAGAPWRDVPERYGAWATLYSRFRRWQRAGIWDRILAACHATADAAGQFDWSLHFVDGSVIRAHQHAAGAKKGVVSKPLAGVAVASAPSSMSAPSAAASPSS